ncbi:MULTISPECIES: putative periplasmic lipoprotein [Trueperella]|uniref:DUF732 domain-containing protein n=1 Tax=Trueperella abortisuis TaxID=445930 RepID=A0ABT9PGC1_9ACTO|nr:MULTISPECIES: hypothetical protein [Trueperella]MCI7304905.1 hypothetical protein [Trueperella sp.]MDP9831763.1 hypothetical protein [Trueperella abortisuis]MDY5404594.1 hypothetical protein [Trueperella sp.]
MKKMAFAFALALGLTACANTDPGPAQTSSASTQATPSTEATTQAAEKTTEPAQGQTGTASSDVDSQGNPKASKEEFKAVLLKGANAALEQQGKTSDPEMTAQINEAAQCMADFAYDKLSADTLNTLISDPTTTPSDADLSVLFEAAMKCQPATGQ